MTEVKEAVPQRQIGITLPSNRPAAVIVPVGLTPMDIGYITQCLTDVLMQETAGTAPKPSPIVIARGKLQ